MKINKLLHTLFWALTTLGVALPTLADNTGVINNNAVLRSPPVAEKVFVKRLKKPTEQGNAQVSVRFKKDQRLKTALRASDNLEKRTLSIQLEETKLLLNDNGRAGDEKANDGVFSAITHFDFEEFAAQQKARAQLARKVRSVPVFAGRQFVGKRKLEVIDPRVIRAGARIDLSKLLGIAAAVAPEKELMITATSVVEDPTRTFDVCTRAGTPMGQWTFGHLMEAMANQADTGIDPRDFTREWLAKWEADQAVNGFTVPKRLSIQNRVINPWPLDGAGKLDLSEAPMRLLAIVNRVDLRENLIYGGGSAGEARFVFGVIDRSGGGCNQMPFTVIFEYGINKANCPEVKAWAQQWHDLGSMPQGTPAEIAAFNAALQAITDQFTEAGADPSKTPNKSALNQLRTNEIALAAPWELREFVIRTDSADTAHLDGATAIGHLAQATVKQTPSTGDAGTPFPGFLIDSPEVRDYVNANAADILLDKHVVPLEFPAGTPFLGGSSLNQIDFWRAAGIADNEARHHFSFNTCDACHGRETQTGFLHIGTRNAGAAATLSGFLTGIDVVDPVDAATTRHFDDLERRAADLESLVNSSCLFRLFDKPLLMVH
ncbi:MAG: choice-of-anchor X domain-containing protein [Pseudomonadota bacterium]